MGAGELYNLGFWRSAVERAVKTACQTALVIVGGNAFNAFAADWKAVLGAASGGAVLSLLTSLGSEPFGPGGSPSIVVGHDPYADV